MNQQPAPNNGQTVRFPGIYGRVVFETVDREAGAYRVVTSGTVVQVNTDATHWEPAP